MRKMLLLALTAVAVMACEDDPPAQDADLTGEWVGHYTVPDATNNRQATMEMLHTGGGLLSGMWTETAGVATVSGEKTGVSVTLTLRFADDCRMDVDGGVSVNSTDHLTLRGEYQATDCPGLTTGDVQMDGPPAPLDEDVTGVN